MYPGAYGEFCEAYSALISDPIGGLLKHYPAVAFYEKEITDLDGKPFTYQFYLPEASEGEQAFAIDRVVEGLSLKMSNGDFAGSQKVIAAAHMQALIDWQIARLPQYEASYKTYFADAIANVEKVTNSINNLTYAHSLSHHLAERVYLRDTFPDCHLTAQLAEGVQLNTASGGQPDWELEDWSALLPPAASAEDKSVAANRASR